MRSVPIGLAARRSWKRTLIAVALGLFAVSAAESAWLRREPGRASRPNGSASVIGDSSLPRQGYATDRQIAGIQESLRDHRDDSEAYRALGTLFIQKAREDGDARYL